MPPIASTGSLMRLAYRPIVAGFAHTSSAFVRRIGFPLALLCAIGCSEPSDCTLIASPDVVVYVVDSVSGLPAAMGARGAVERGVFRDSLRPFEARGLAPNDTVISLQANGQGAGSYRVTVEKVGYYPWEQTGVRITPNPCRYTSATLTAKLRARP